MARLYRVLAQLGSNVSLFQHWRAPLLPMPEGRGIRGEEIDEVS